MPAPTEAQCQRVWCVVTGQPWPGMGSGRGCEQERGRLIGGIGGRCHSGRREQGRRRMVGS